MTLPTEARRTTEWTMEKYCQETGLDYEIARDWAIGRSTVKWHPADIRKLSRDRYMLAIAPPNAAGRGARPRTVPNTDLLHKRGRRLPVDVNAVKDPAIPRMPHPDAQDIEGNPALRMVSGEGMPEGFQVFRRAGRAPHTAQE